MIDSVYRGRSQTYLRSGQVVGLLVPTDEKRGFTLGGYGVVFSHRWPSNKEELIRILCFVILLASTPDDEAGVTHVTGSVLGENMSDQCRR